MTTHTNPRNTITRISLVGMAAVAALTAVCGCAHDAPSGTTGTKPPEPQRVRQTNPATQPAPQALGHGYTRRGDHIEFEGQRIDVAGRHDLHRFARVFGRPLVLAENVDADSFVALSEEYTKDRNRVYYKWISPGRFWVVQVPDADPASFEVMDFNLARDTNHVWRTDVQIPDADPHTAVVLRPKWVWRDQDSVYYQFTRLERADPETFRHLGQGFYRDDNNIYWGPRRLANADPASFTAFGDVPYAADARNVWCANRTLPHVDAASFRLLRNHVFADAERVYVSTAAHPVPDAHAHSFREIGPLTSAGCVLFRDDTRHYIYEPGYNEIYTLTPDGDRVVITKTLWKARAGAEPEPFALVSAVWSNGALSKPKIRRPAGSQGGRRPNQEPGKFQRVADAISEAAERMNPRSSTAPPASLSARP